MSTAILESIEEMIQSKPQLDRQGTFDQLWALLGELFASVQGRFELRRDPSSHDLTPYQGQQGASGYLATYAGPEIDWLVHSWTGNPRATFTNMHLTVSLGPQIDAPHFGLALGTTPDLFLYMDYLPRHDLWTHPDYGDHYYDKANLAFLKMQAHPAFRSFVSRDFYTRVAQTPASICLGAPVTEDNLATVRALARAHLDTWFELVGKARPVPASEREAMAARDLLVRRTITERDPANVVVDKLFGKDMGQRLVRQLWGGDRQLPRPR